MKFGLIVGNVFFSVAVILSYNKHIKVLNNQWFCNMFCRY